MQLARNVLIFHTGALGDFILTWPLAIALGRLFPQSRIFYVTHSDKGALSSRLLGIESADVELGWHFLHGPDTVLPDPARSLLTKAHTIFSFISQPEDDWSRNVMRMAPKADLCILQPKPPVDYAKPVHDFYIQQLSVWKAVQQGIRGILQSLADRGLGQKANREGPVLIHPGSGSHEKCWPATHYIELAQRIQRKGLQACFVVGEVELERWPKQQIQRLEQTAPVRTCLSSSQLLDQLLTCRAFIGNDSGPSHLAGILGLPTWVLFGPTNPVVWRPVGPQVHVMDQQPLEGLGVDQVFDWFCGADRKRSEESQRQVSPLEMAWSSLFTG